MVALVVLAGVTAVSVVLGAAKFRTLVRENPEVTHLDIHRHLPYLVPLVLGLIILLGFVVFASLHHRLSWALPYWIELVGENVAWGLLMGVLGFLFTLSCLSLFRSGHPKRWTLLALVAAFLGALLYVNWKIYLPISPLLTPRELSDGVVMQTHGASCVAASAANIARYYGREKTEQEMARLLGSTVMGTSPAQLVRGMRRIGISCRKVMISDRDPLRLEVPALLFVDHPQAGPEAHAVVLLGQKGEWCVVVDPMVGEIKISRERLSAMWRGRAIECALSPESSSEEQ